MARMNALIPLQVDSPDIIGSLSAGNKLGRDVGLADLYRQHGEGIISGDANALNALARFDPAQALGVQGARQDMAAQSEMMGIRANAEGRAQWTFEQQQEAMRTQQQLEKAIGAISSAQTPEQWDQLARTGGYDDLVGQFGNKSALLAQIVPLEEQLRMQIAANAPRAPGNDYERYAMREIEAGRQPVDEFTYREKVNVTKGPLVQNFVGTGESGSDLPILPPDPESNVPAGSGRSSFGLGGALTNAANAASDFAFGVEIAPTTAENTRFFKAFEEDALVGLSQAYGRQPAQQLMDNLRSLLPNVGRDGPQGAYREAVTLRERFVRDLGIARSAAQRARTPSQAQEAEQRALGLESAIRQFDEAVRRLQPEGSGVVIAPEVEERLKAYE